MTDPFESFTGDELDELVRRGNESREQIAGEAAARLGFALIAALLDYHGDDPRLGDAMLARLATAAAGQPPYVAGVLQTAARTIVERTGCTMPAAFRSN